MRGTVAAGRNRCLNLHWWYRYYTANSCYSNGRVAAGLFRSSRQGSGISTHPSSRPLLRVEAWLSDLIDAMKGALMGQLDAVRRGKG